MSADNQNSDTPPAPPAATSEGAPTETPEPAAETSAVALAEEPPPPTPAEHEALRRENAELHEQLLRRRADFENFKKRVERERATFGQDALAALLKDLVPSLDNLERALQACGDAVGVRDGVALIQRSLLSALEAHGLRVDDPLGTRFDPQNHQALSYDEAPGHSEGTVSLVFGKGYFLNDRLLRPALVQVARGSAAAQDTQAQGTPGDDTLAPETLH